MKTPYSVAHIISTPSGFVQPFNESNTSDPRMRWALPRFQIRIAVDASGFRMKFSDSKTQPAIWITIRYLSTNLRSNRPHVIHFHFRIYSCFHWPVSRTSDFQIRACRAFRRCGFQHTLRSCHLFPWRFPPSLSVRLFPSFFLLPILNIRLLC